MHGEQLFALVFVLFMFCGVLGIVVVAVGLGLMTVISIASGEPEVGIGIGGAITIIGIAFIVNSLVNKPYVPASEMPPAPPGRPPLDPLSLVM